MKQLNGFLSGKSPFLMTMRSFEDDCHDPDPLFE